MHELALAQALVEQVDQIRVKENARAVVAVTVNLGALSGVDRMSFEFAFPLAVEGTRSAGTVLHVVETPAEVTCDACGARSHPGLDNLRCVPCGSERVRITGGRDFLIQSVELEFDDGDTDRR